MGRLMYRRNADEGLRRRERESFASDDPESLAARARAARRAGGDVLSWETTPAGWVFLRSFLLGKEGRVEAQPKPIGGELPPVERFYITAVRLPDRGNTSRGPRYTWPQEIPFYDWRPWVDTSGVVVVPQEPLEVDGWDPLTNTLYKIAVRYYVTPDEIWDANVPADVDIEGDGSVRGIHPYWQDPPFAIPDVWYTGNFGAPVQIPLTASYAERFRHYRLADPWMETGAISHVGKVRMTVPPSGRWAVLARGTRSKAGEQGIGTKGTTDATALRPEDFAWARIMQRRGKRWV